MKLRNAGIEWVCSVGMPSNMKPIVVSVHIDPWINSDWIYTHLPAGQILCSCLCGSSFWRAPRCKVLGPRGPANFRHWMDTSAFSRSILGRPQDAPGIVTKKPSSWRMAWWVEVWVGPRPPFTVRTLPWLLRSLALRSHLAQGQILLFSQWSEVDGTCEDGSRRMREHVRMIFEMCHHGKHSP